MPSSKIFGPATMGI